MYNLAIEHKLWCLIGNLAENDVTPDEILFDIIDRLNNILISLNYDIIKISDFVIKSDNEIAIKNSPVATGL